MDAMQIARKCLPVVLLDFTLAEWKPDGTCQDEWESVDALGMDLRLRGCLPKGRRIYPGKHFWFKQVPSFFVDKGSGAIGAKDFWLDEKG